MDRDKSPTHSEDETQSSSSYSDSEDEATHSQEPTPSDVGLPKALAHSHGAETLGRSNVIYSHGHRHSIQRPHRLHRVPQKDVNAVREAMRASHRFQSFAGARQDNFVKWYIDGHDYFWAVSEMIDEAKDCIFIIYWWLSPEIYLRRPPTNYPGWRLDRLLKRKAEEGVRVYTIIYKEIKFALKMSSAYTKKTLEGLHRNIRVSRHPDHTRLKHDVELWSHHEKILIVDNHKACVGGLDLCFGRRDIRNHPLADVHPTEFSKTLFPGQLYNNGRVLDFQHVDNFVSNQVSNSGNATDAVARCSPCFRRPSRGGSNPALH